jgi:hypothetical protein
MDGLDVLIALLCVSKDTLVINRMSALDNYGHDFQPYCVTINNSPCIVQPVPQYWQALFG